MAGTVHPTVVKPAEGTQLWLLGDHLTLKLGPEHTGGTFSVAEIVVPPGGGPPPHLHAREDELFFVLDGIFSFFLDGRTYTGMPGASVYLPKGIPHTYRNAGDRTGRFLWFGVPSGFERFFTEVGSRTRPPSAAIDPADVERVMTAAPRYGLNMNPELGGPPQDAGLCPDGRCLAVMGLLVTLKLTSADTAGRFTAAEIRAWPGGGPPAHSHRTQDELFYVLEGTFEFLLGDKSETHGPGTLVYVPRGTPHTFRNVGAAPARLFDLHTPGGFEAFFEEAGQPAPDRETQPATPAEPPDMAAVRALLDRHGMDTV